jgi:hypothetical protein
VLVLVKLKHPPAQVLVLLAVKLAAGGWLGEAMVMV